MNTKGVEDGITDGFNEGVKAAAKVFEGAGMIHNEVYALLKPPTLPVPERTAEMDELIARLRREAFHESDWPVAVSRKDINALLDQIEGKPK